METGTGRGYKQASRSQPCRICGAVHWCTEAADGATFCRRVWDGEPSLDKNGDPYGLHFPAGVKNGRVVELPPVPIRAAAEVLDTVYRSVLRRLPLCGRHREKLAARGVSAERFFELGYRTLDGGREGLMAPIVGEFGQAALREVPGFRLSRGRPWLHGAAGMVFPVRNPRGQVVALSVRSTTAGGAKYSWVSSTGHDGPGPGSPVHVPLFTGDRRVVRVTEGALKADVATALGGIWTLGLPGVGGIARCVEILAEIVPEVVLLAYDRDAESNDNVARAQARAWERLIREGYPVRLEVWE